MTCIEDIYDDLVVGHGLQMGHYCRASPEAPISPFEPDETVVLSAQSAAQQGNAPEGDYYYSDYHYECGFRDQFLQLDDQTNYPGDRLTCLTVVDVAEAHVNRFLPTVAVFTDWRMNDNGRTLDPSCYDFQPHLGGNNPMINVTKTP